MADPSPELARSMGAVLERGLPLTRAPFEAVARELGVREADAIKATATLLSDGLLRRLGAFVDFRPLGLRGYLFGLQASEEACVKIAESFADVDYVTHIYERRASPNLWFTAILPGDAAALGMSRDLPCPHAVLAAVRRIKLEPAFARGGRPRAREVFPHLQGDEAPLLPLQKDDYVVLSPEQRAVLCLAQADFPVESRPFARLGSRAGLSEDEVLACLRALAFLGVLRRIGASLHHVRAGYSSNSLIAWNFSGEPEERVLDAASLITGNGWLSHCYLRRILMDTLDFGWRYNLFTMIHACSDDELREREEILASAFRGRGYVSMRTEREWKKTSYRVQGNADEIVQTAI